MCTRIVNDASLAYITFIMDPYAMCRCMDPFKFNNEIVEWVGKKLHERQQLGQELARKKKLLTPFAGFLVGQEEVYARERNYTVKPMGHNNFQVTWKKKGDTKTYMVNLSRKKCTCQFPGLYLLPCSHAIIAEDSLKSRDTPKKMLQFRKK